MVSHPEPDILESKVKWALRNSALNKASGFDEIPAKIFKSLKDDAIKVLHSLCHQMKTQQWPQDWKRSILILTPKKDPKNVLNMGQLHSFPMLVSEVTQSCPTLCNPMDCSLPGSSVHGIFQARILEWVAISHSRESSQPSDQTHISCISCIGGQILYHCTTWEAPWVDLPSPITLKEPR